MHSNSHHIIIHQIIILPKPHNVNMKTTTTTTTTTTKTKGGGVIKGKGNDCEITIKYRTLLLWFISISIIVVSCSQIYFFLPPDADEYYDGRQRRSNENYSRQHGSRYQQSGGGKTTKGTGGSSISSISKIIAKRQDYGRNGIINNKKTITATKEQRVGIVDNTNNHDDVEAEILTDKNSIPTTKVAKNSDGSINHKQIYKNHISNYNKYLHQHNNIDGNAILLPDIEKELEETEIVAIKRKSSHNDDDNNDNDDDDEPWLILHIGTFCNLYV